MLSREAGADSIAIVKYVTIHHRISAKCDGFEEKYATDKSEVGCMSAMQAMQAGCRSRAGLGADNLGASHLTYILRFGFVNNLSLVPAVVSAIYSLVDVLADLRFSHCEHEIAMRLTDSDSE